MLVPQEKEEPKGISFFNVKSGDTHYCKLEPTIQAYINSSDMGINASRGQDYGWKLAPEWVLAVREFRNDESKMDTLAAKLRLEDGESPNTIQILFYIYSRQVREYMRNLQENESPYEEAYRQKISGKTNEIMPEAEPVSETVTEADLGLDAEPEPTAPAPKPANKK